jgi:hypothetical protein
MIAIAAPALGIEVCVLMCTDGRPPPPPPSTGSLVVLGGINLALILLLEFP